MSELLPLGCSTKEEEAEADAVLLKTPPVLGGQEGGFAAGLSSWEMGSQEFLHESSWTTLTEYLLGIRQVYESLKQFLGCLQQYENFTLWYGEGHVKT